jgi:hypothetical protein
MSAQDLQSQSKSRKKLQNPRETAISRHCFVVRFAVPRRGMNEHSGAEIVSFGGFRFDRRHSL